MPTAAEGNQCQQRCAKELKRCVHYPITPLVLTEDGT